MIHETSIPSGSDIERYARGAYFADAYSAPCPADGRTALQLYLDHMARTPGWVSALMRLRNRLVRLVGLKDLGGFGLQPGQSSTPCPGDRVGIFTLVSAHDDEVVLTDADRHLDVWVSVRRPAPQHPQQVVVSTVVKVHNRLGRLYMFFVAPMHKRIVPAVLARLPAA